MADSFYRCSSHSFYSLNEFSIRSKSKEAEEVNPARSFNKRSGLYVQQTTHSCSYLWCCVHWWLWELQNNESSLQILWRNDSIGGDVGYGDQIPTVLLKYARSGGTSLKEKAVEAPYDDNKLTLNDRFEAVSFFWRFIRSFMLYDCKAY